MTSAFRRVLGTTLANSFTGIRFVEGTMKRREFL